MSDEAPQALGRLEFRAAQQLAVSFPKRIIELIVTPYETEALVPHPRDHSKLITEVFSRGAYDGIERRPNRIRLNRDHDITRTVGRAVALHPSRQEGLVAEVRVAQTDLGDETLTLADEGILDVSAGFAVMPGGDRWETRARRRITKAWLGHIAMTPDPAYVSANVLAVRNAEDVAPLEVIATPNLDVVRAWRLESDYSLLSKTTSST
jgi:HK97 family phage prohead protease